MRERILAIVILSSIILALPCSSVLAEPEDADAELKSEIRAIATSVWVINGEVAALEAGIERLEDRLNAHTSELKDEIGSIHRDHDPRLQGIETNVDWIKKTQDEIKGDLKDIRKDIKEEARQTRKTILVAALPPGAVAMAFAILTYAMTRKG